MGALQVVKRIVNGIVSIGLTLILACGMILNLAFIGSHDVTGEWFPIILLAGWFWLRTLITEKDKERNIYHILLERVLLVIPGVEYMAYIVLNMMRYGTVPEWTFSESVHVMSYVFWFLVLANYIVVPIVFLIITVKRMYKNRVLN